MNTATKLLASMRANPRDWRIEQLQTVARQHNVTWRHHGTSHCYFIFPNGDALSVPAHRPVKPIYVSQFVALIGD